MVNIHRTNK